MANKLNVLVVEDDASIRNLITTTLKAHEYKYLSAYNGNSALLEASTHNPDVILLDLGLPDMDGIEVRRYAVFLWCQSLLFLLEVKMMIRFRH